MVICVRPVLILSERPLPAPSSHSQIRKCVVLHQNSYGRFRLQAAGQIIELRQAENDPVRSFMIVAASVGFQIANRSSNCGDRLGC